MQAILSQLAQGGIALLVAIIAIILAVRLLGKLAKLIIVAVIIAVVLWFLMSNDGIMQYAKDLFPVALDKVKGLIG